MLPEVHQVEQSDESLFAKIALDIEQHGYSINRHALDLDLARGLFEYQDQLNAAKFSAAGIGRGEDFTQDEAIRTDSICWIYGTSDIGQQWLDWAATLKRYLNRRLFLGLFSFESHFAHYSPGDFYKRHRDAFVGEANRVLSIVVYLNPDWNTANGGELVLYKNDNDSEGIVVAPEFATVVAFLSEEFPHEVLPAKEDRYSIAGWFRVNGSIDNKIDPPL